MNIEAADRIDESAELITAAEIAPSPIVENRVVNLLVKRAELAQLSLSVGL